MGPGERHVADLASHSKDWRSRIPAHTQSPEAGSGRAALTAECRGRLPLLLLERPELAQSHGGYRGTDAVRRLQEIGSQECSRASISAYAGNAALGEGRHLRGRCRHPGEQPDVVRKHYAKWSKGRQANIDRLMLAHFDKATTNPVTNMSHEKTGTAN
jgi:hypothetical protein